MSPAEARGRLLELRREVTGRLMDLGASFDDIVEAARDSNLDDEHDPEGSTIAVDRQMVTALTRAAEHQLAEIDAALGRVEDGTYGSCTSCGASIPDARLEARPAAPTCLACA